MSAPLPPNASGNTTASRAAPAVATIGSTVSPTANRGTANSVEYATPLTKIRSLFAPDEAQVPSGDAVRNRPVSPTDQPARLKAFSPFDDVRDTLPAPLPAESTTSQYVVDGCNSTPDAASKTCEPLAKVADRAVNAATRPPTAPDESACTATSAAAPPEMPSNDNPTELSR